MNIYDELHWRGLIADCTDPAIKTGGGVAARDPSGLYHQEPITLYCGFDPTSDSLHVGNLVPLLALRRFQKRGHCPILVAGGATGSIGDPSGRTDERQLLNRDGLRHNISRVKEQLRRWLDFDSRTNPARLLDNADWTSGVSYLDFLRDIGKHFSVNMMVAKESVRARMEDREAGISYTEFSYMLLQAFDFHHLCKEHDCTLQIGGSDQWGNITAGIDLCRKKLGRQVHGLTLPLITNADGTKFGKSVAGAVWLDPARTTPYRFYQFWVRADDRDVIRFLKYFTFLDPDEIAALEHQHAAKPETRTAQKALAEAMTSLIHGPSAAREAIRASEILFGGSLEGIDERTFQDLAEEIPTCEVDRSRFENAGIPLVELLVDAGLSSSKGQARKDIEGGGVYLNNARANSAQRSVGPSDFLIGGRLLLRKGKKSYVLIVLRD